MSDRMYLLRVRLLSTGGIWSHYSTVTPPKQFEYQEASTLADKLWDQGYETQIIAVGHDELK